MAGRRKGASLGKIRNAVRDVRDSVAGARVHPDDRHAHKATLNFLESLDGMVSAFCLRLSDGAEDVLDASRPRGPRPWPPRPKPGARRSR